MTGFSPVSKIPYFPLKAEAQALVCVLHNYISHDPVADARKTWEGRAAAVFLFKYGETKLRDLVIDLLANPQIRVVVLVHPAHINQGPEASVIRQFWDGHADIKGWGIQQSHLDLVRHFVDLFDDDCGMYGPLQPFWPERIVYGPQETGERAAP